MTDEANRPTISLTLTPEQRELLRQATGQELTGLELARESVAPSPRPPRFLITPDLEFFRRLGLYVVRGFFEADLCARVRAEIRSASGVPAEVYLGDGPEPVVDENLRRTTTAQVSTATAALVTARLQPLMPTLERHFHVQTTGWQTPRFYLYRTGDFCHPHDDRVPGRRVVAVIFLNGGGTGPDSYGGGALTFCRLSRDPRFEEYGYPLVGETGLLVAFPPDIVHAVTPVTSGERHTIVTWLEG